MMSMLTCYAMGRGRLPNKAIPEVNSLLLIVTNLLFVDRNHMGARRRHKPSICRWYI